LAVEAQLERVVALLEIERAEVSAVAVVAGFDGWRDGVRVPSELLVVAVLVARLDREGEGGEG